MIFRKLCFVCFTTYILNNETMHRSALSKAADTRSRNLYQNLVQDILYQKLASVSVNLAPDFSCTRILNWIERSSISMQHLATTWLKSRDVIVWPIHERWQTAIAHMIAKYREIFLSQFSCARNCNENNILHDLASSFWCKFLVQDVLHKIPVQVSWACVGSLSHFSTWHRASLSLTLSLTLTLTFIGLLVQLTASMLCSLYASGKCCLRNDLPMCLEGH